MTEIVDFRSVSLSGAISMARARLLHQDGFVRLYDATGFYKELISDPPARVPGFIRNWDVNTEIGTIRVKPKCIACGGKSWIKFASLPTEYVWNSYG